MELHDVIFTIERHHLVPNRYKSNKNKLIEVAFIRTTAGHLSTQNRAAGC